MDKLIKSIFFVLSLLILYGCATTKVHYFGKEKYKPTRSVELLDHRPKRLYVEIAILEDKAPHYVDGQFVFEKMKNKAQKIGAHAIIPIEYHSIPQVQTTRIGSTYPHPIRPGQRTTPRRVFRMVPKVWAKAIAIRYLTENEQSKPADIE